MEPDMGKQKQKAIEISQAQDLEALDREMQERAERVKKLLENEPASKTLLERLKAWP